MCNGINFVCMCPIPRPKTMVIGLGTRLLCNGVRERRERGSYLQKFIYYGVGYMCNGIWGQRGREKRGDGVRGIFTDVH